MKDRPRPDFANAYRLVAASVFVTLAWDTRAYLTMLQVHRTEPVHSSFFPRIFEFPTLHYGALAVVALLSLACAIRPARGLMRTHAVLTPLLTMPLLVGPYFFARQAWVVILWTSVWMLWVAFEAAGDEASRRVGSSLALVLVSFVFLGAAIGKLTDGYTSGQAMFHLIFLIQGDAKFELLRDLLSTEQLAVLSRWFSRLAIAGEAGLAGSALLPARVGLPVAFVLLIGMWLSSPLGIINAIGPLLGLILAGLVLLGPPRRPLSPAGR
jgi:hypothetical protein